MLAPATAPEDAAKVTQAATAAQTAQAAQTSPELDHEEQSEEQSEKNASNGSADEEPTTKEPITKEPITKEPAAQDNMHLTPNKETNSDGSSTHRTSTSVSEQGSGYQREANECTEFCTDFLTCFGLFDACCPATGEGCLANCATFCGTVLISCTKC